MKPELLRQAAEAGLEAVREIIVSKASDNTRSVLGPASHVQSLVELSSLEDIDTVPIRVQRHNA